MEFEKGDPTRNAYGKALLELGKQHEDIVALDADLAKSTRSYMFEEEFPERHFNVGIQESNMVGMAAGLASSGLTPFVHSFACFLCNRAFDQIRVSVAYPGLDVNFVGSHGGISGGEDGVSQQSVEDLALMNTVPDITACVPADPAATRQLAPQLLDFEGPTYMRTSRPPAQLVYDDDEEFTMGEAKVVRSGSDVTIVTMGLLVAESLKAASKLASRGIEAEVIDSHTVKPLDVETIVASASKTGHLVVAEEHQIWGGLSSIVSREVSQYEPVPMEFVAIDDTYAESGPGYELLNVYGLTEPHIVDAVETVLSESLEGTSRAPAAAVN
ncbi:MAG: transketolase family protein [bacterium]